MNFKMTIERILHRVGLGDPLKFIYRYGFARFKMPNQDLPGDMIPIPTPYLIHLVIGQPNQKLFLDSGQS